MIVVHARVRSRPETREETVAAMVEMQRASRSQDGCVGPLTAGPSEISLFEAEPLSPDVLP